MTTQIEVMYLNEPTVEVNVQEKEIDVTMDMDMDMDMLDKMDVVEQKEKVLEEGSEREDSEVEDDDDDDDAPAAVAVPKSQDIFVDRVGNKNKNKKPRKSLEKKSKSFTLRATKRLFKSFSKRKSLSSKDDTRQAEAETVAAAAAAVPALSSISTKPTFESTNESEEEVGVDRVIDITHDDHDHEHDDDVDDDDSIDMTEMMIQEELTKHQTEKKEQQQQEAITDEVTDEEYAEDDNVDGIDVLDDIDNDEDNDHIKLEAEGVEEAQVEEVETAADDAVINEVTEPLASLAEVSTPFMNVQGAKTDFTINEEDDEDEDDEDEDEEQYKLVAEGAVQIQEQEATAADSVRNKVLDPSSSVKVLTPFVKEEEKEETSSRTLLFVAMWLIVGITINIYCNSKYYDLFFMDQGQQVQEQEDVTIAEILQAATTNVTPKRNVVLVVTKWVRTIITNKRN